jgi:ElaB/YqjD/DUF883 family membrane-anchored ribosome-binding protein
MSESVLEKADAQIAEAAHKVAQCTTAFADALEDALRAVKRVGKHGSEVAEEFVEDAEQRLKRHPIESVVAGFAIGCLCGGLLGWLIARR